jgi:type I restriction enzyme S subunit
MALDLSFVQHVKPPEGSEGVRTQVQKNDILVCITGALTGNVALVDMDLPSAFVNQHVALIRPRLQKIVPRYLAYVLHSEIGKSQFKTSEYGGTKQGLSLDDVKSVVVAVPPLDEQRAITRHLETQLERFTGPVTAATREIAVVREYRSRLISDVVTGKADVRDATKRLPEGIEELVPEMESEESTETGREELPVESEDAVEEAQG